MVIFLLVLLTLPVLLEKFDTALFVAYAVMNIFAFIFAWYKVVETKGKSLEKIECELYKSAAKQQNSLF